MPKEPQLPVPDWKDAFIHAREFSRWAERDFDKPDNIQEILDFIVSEDIGASAKARLKALERKVNILVFAECWCPDVVRHLPIVECFARLPGKIHARTCSPAT